jgi:hypothetical protein
MHYREVAGLCPPWQVTKGYKMTVAPSEPILTLVGSAAQLTIQEDLDEDHWRVSWWLNHGHGEVQGFVSFNRQDLRRAFGFEDGISEGDRSLFAGIGTPLDAGQVGRYVRYGQYLNIPGPGRSFHGDPNISIELTNEIVAAVEALLAPKMAPA